MRCVACGHLCVPMADYELPVCIPCDERVTAILDRAGLLLPDNTTLDDLIPRMPPPSRPWSSYFGEEPGALEALAAAMSKPRRRPATSDDRAEPADPPRRRATTRKRPATTAHTIGVAS